jgi:ABC-2 type transport system permease protein
MRDIASLLAPRFRPLFRRGILANLRGGIWKMLFLTTLGGFLWWALFILAMRVLSYFRGIEEIGDILGYRMLSMILIISFALLLFSSILTALSKLYLAKDLLLVHSLPVATHKVFVARWVEATLDSSWMVVVFTSPVFGAYGVIYAVQPYYYAVTFLSLLSMAVIASTTSTLLVMAGVLIVPASRMKSVVVLLGVLFFVLLYLAIRLMRPEQLVDPEIFDSVLVYVTSLQTPSSPLLPTTWAFDGIRSALMRSEPNGLFHLALSMSCAGALLCLATVVADLVYFKGFSKTQTAPPRLLKRAGISERVFAFLPGTAKAFTVKEIKTFLRDQTQWSQLFLVAALIVIYVYNFKVLPLEKSPIKTIYLQNLFAFLNMGLALFVLTAVAARFAYPAVSCEGEAFWLVQSSPLSLRTYLRIKFFIYYIPLLFLTETLIVATNMLLNVTAFMMALSTATVFFMVPAIVALAIGFGAAYPDFNAENPAQSVTSFGGLLYMIVCSGYIVLVILIEAGPVYRLFMSHLHSRPLALQTWSWIAAALASVPVLSLLAVILPLRFGRRQLARIHA